MTLFYELSVLSCTLNCASLWKGRQNARHNADSLALKYVRLLRKLKSFQISSLIPVSLIHVIKQP